MRKVKFVFCHFPDSRVLLSVRSKRKRRLDAPHSDLVSGGGSARKTPKTPTWRSPPQNSCADSSCRKDAYPAGSDETPEKSAALRPVSCWPGHEGSLRKTAHPPLA